MRHYTPGQTPDEPPETTGSIPFGVKLLAVIAGIVILVMGAESMRQDYREIRKLTHLDTDYRAQPGTWVQVKVRQDSSGSGKFYPDVLFEYFVGGKSVWGWRLSLEEHPRPEGYWENRLAGYRVGDTVTVHVNPLDAKDSFVEMKTDGLIRPLLKGLVGLAFCVFGAFLLFIPLGGWLRSLRGRSRSPSR
jgi:hypothetical protein